MIFIHLCGVKCPRMTKCLTCSAWQRCIGRLFYSEGVFHGDMLIPIGLCLATSQNNISFFSNCLLPNFLRMVPVLQCYMVIGYQYNIMALGGEVKIPNKR